MVFEDGIRRAGVVSRVSFSLRADEDGQAAISRLRGYTRARSNAKAIWQAIREYPARCEQLAEALERERTLLRELTDVRSAVVRWNEATVELAGLAYGRKARETENAGMP